MEFSVNKKQVVDKLRHLGLRDAEVYALVMPEMYFEKTDDDDFRQHEVFFDKFVGAGRGNCLMHYKGDIEEFVFIDYQIQKLREQIARYTSQLRSNELLYRIFPNKKQGFILAAIYGDVMLGARAAEFTPPVFENFTNDFFESNGKMKTHLYSNYNSSTRCFTIRCINVAHKTMLGNLLETIDQHEISVDMIEVWRLRNATARVMSFYEINLFVAQHLPEDEVVSLQSDFYRYIQHFTEPMSVFDLVGPAMVGPSSSHTAGANRIGQIARSIMMAKQQQGEVLKSVAVKLIGSFRDTGVGHKTPSALGGGLWGLATNDEEMIAHGEPEFLKQQGVKIGEQHLVFEGFLKGSPADDEKYAAEKNSNIAEILFTTQCNTYTITGFSIGGGNVEVRYFGNALETPINGKTDFYLDGDRIVAKQNENISLPVIKSIYGESVEPGSYIMPFNTFEELIEYSTNTQKSIPEIAIEAEISLQSTSRLMVYETMQQYWEIMRSSVEKGVKSTQLSLLKLSGDDAFKMNNYRHTNLLFDNIYGKATAYATAVNELNAKSGVIVACPTAGSCGILPGVLTAYCDTQVVDEKKLLDSLVVAGFLGMLLFNDVSTAGADFGCQAEVGSAAAMAAAALCYLENGDTEAIVSAFTLAIKNSLGLICDPIAGLVEVPCVKRNGIYASVAISAAFMALSGVRSFVSPDEVILTMREVGERINSDYKETARAGLAKTRDGKHVERMFESEVKKFFQ